MTQPGWKARLLPGTRGYPLLERDVWYDVVDSDSLGCIISLWGKHIFMFSEDAELRPLPPFDAGLIGTSPETSQPASHIPGLEV